MTVQLTGPEMRYCSNTPGKLLVFKTHLKHPVLCEASPLKPQERILPQDTVWVANKMSCGSRSSFRAAISSFSSFPSASVRCHQIRAYEREGKGERQECRITGRKASGPGHRVREADFISFLCTPLPTPVTVQKQWIGYPGKDPSKHLTSRKSRGEAEQTGI